MENITDGLMDVFERIWAMQGREGTFEEFLQKRVNTSEEERVKQSVAYHNAREGNLHEADGYNCKKCLNKGEIWWAVLHNGHWIEQFRRCDCMRARAAIRRMEKSGLKDSLKKLSDFEVTEPFQAGMLEAATEYIKADKSKGATLFIGGAVGCGKTFVCSAVCRELLLTGHEVLYMPWMTEAERLKNLATDESRTAEISVYADAEYLYIDDLFKPTGTNSAPTPADVKLAYSIINHRYLNNLPTIISSEKYMPELLEIDEATISRVYEKSKGFMVNVKRDPKRNYRMKGADAIV